MQNVYHSFYPPVRTDISFQVQWLNCRIGLATLLCFNLYLCLFTFQLCAMVRKKSDGGAET